MDPFSRRRYRSKEYTVVALEKLQNNRDTKPNLFDNFANMSLHLLLVGGYAGLYRPKWFAVIFYTIAK